MHVTSEVIDLPKLRLRTFTPVHPTVARWPVVVAWSDIFQHTGPHLRLCTRLASHGYLVITPELYGRFEPAGTVLRFEEDRQRALDNAAKMQLAWFDEDLEATLGAARSHPRADASRLAACGWCLGGHLAFRAALHAEVRVTACFYATGLHSNSLGAAVGSANSLAEAGRIRGELLLVWGAADPHIPPEGRARIHGALAAAGTAFHSRTYQAEHAFMRDEGARWQAAAADEAFGELRSVLRVLQAS